MLKTPVIAIKVKAVVIAICILLLVGACGGPQVADREQESALPGVKAIQKGVQWYRQGCYYQALTHFYRAHERFTAVDDLPGIAMSLNNIGNVYRVIGDADSAIMFFDNALACYTQVGDSAGILKALSNKAAVYIQIQQLDEAEAILAKARSIAAESHITSAALLNNRGILLTQRGDYEAAEVVLRQALTAAETASAPERATVYFSMGNLLVDRRQHENALHFFNQALIADRTNGFHEGIADDLTAIAKIHVQLQQESLALAFLERAVKIYALLNKTQKVSELMQQIDAVAGRIDGNPAVTKHFVQRWLNGDVLARPCE